MNVGSRIRVWEGGRGGGGKGEGEADIKARERRLNRLASSLGLGSYDI